MHKMTHTQMNCTINTVTWTVLKNVVNFMRNSPRNNNFSEKLCKITYVIHNGKYSQFWNIWLIPLCNINHGAFTVKKSKHLAIKPSIYTYWVMFVELGLWCLTPLSTIFQLYRGGRFYRKTRRKPPTCRKSLTIFIT